MRRGGGDGGQFKVKGGGPGAGGGLTMMQLILWLDLSVKGVVWRESEVSLDVWGRVDIR